LAFNDLTIYFLLSCSALSGCKCFSIGLYGSEKDSE
jgi:hypothetical protein